MKKRQSGVLMHISSLPGAYGIGSFGQSAYDFVDFLVRTKQRYWQILPLGTTSYGDSPYQSFSAFAGNTHFIDLDILVEQGLLQASDLEGVDFGSDASEVDYAKIYYARRPLLEKAVKRFLEVGDVKDFEKFAQDNQSWLELFAEYMAIKENFDNLAWTEWPDADVRALKAFTQAFNPPLVTIAIHCFPVIDWVTPKLTSCRKFIWWASCDASRLTVDICLEEMWICPHIA